MAISAALAADLEQVAAMQAIYRMFDEEGGLLYVGTSAHMGKRLSSHAEKRWFLLVATITVEWFPNTEAAERAEADAIAAEHPRINIAGRSVPMPDGPLTLSQAVQYRVLRATLAAVRKQAQRDPEFPASVAKRGTAHLHNPDDLTRYEARRTA